MCFVKIWYHSFQLHELAREEDERSRSESSAQDKNLVVEVPLGARNAVFNFDDDELLDRRPRDLDAEDRYWMGSDKNKNRQDEEEGEEFDYDFNDGSVDISEMRYCYVYGQCQVT